MKAKRILYKTRRNNNTKSKWNHFCYFIKLIKEKKKKNFNLIFFKPENENNFSPISVKINGMNDTNN